MSPIKWPEVGKVAPHYLEHGIILLDEAAKLQAMARQKPIPINVISPFIDSLTEYVRKTREQPTMQELLMEIRNGFKETKDIHEKVTIIKQSWDNTRPDGSLSLNPSSGIRSWAQMAATSPGNATLPSLRPLRTSTLPKTASRHLDREIKVKVRDSHSIQALRRLTEKDIKERIAQALMADPTTTNLASQVTAAKQLKSGDIIIYTSTIEGAEALKGKREWLSTLGTKAEVLEETYGVLVHGVPVSRVNVNNQAQIIEQIKMENNCIIKGMEIKFVGWLSPKTIQNKKASSLIVEFTKPEHANMAIDEGLIIEAAMQQCEYYDRGCKLKQCFNCQQYGHIGSQCTATQACSYCAEAHNAKECEKRMAHPPAEPKCAVCNGKHTSWSNACKKRQEEQIKIKRALATRPGRHRTKDMGTENSGLQATSRNLQVNFGDFPRLAPQTQSSQEPSGQLASKRQRSPTRKVVEGTQPKRRSVATTNRNNKRAALSSIDPNGSVRQSMDWVPQSSASKDTSNATQEGQENTTPSATQSDTIIVHDE
jgi:hypothetical protein